ncbi:hypothetical protein [Parapedobacter soli]|uniref:hypothetical protein n=1 Tax=Parapedobacter soli TaxID=416955 RepID=UPI0021C815D8|nr:hypothetical protein [Parapedobacter soli]
MDKLSNSQPQSERTMILFLKTQRAVDVANKVLASGPHDDDGEFRFALYDKHTMNEADFFLTDFLQEIPSSKLVVGIDYELQNK